MLCSSQRETTSIRPSLLRPPSEGLRQPLPRRSRVLPLSARPAEEQATAGGGTETSSRPRRFGPVSHRSQSPVNASRIHGPSFALQPDRMDPIRALSVPHNRGFGGSRRTRAPLTTGRRAPIKGADRPFSGRAASAVSSVRSFAQRRRVQQRQPSVKHRAGAFNGGQRSSNCDGRRDDYLLGEQETRGCRAPLGSPSFGSVSPELGADRPRGRAIRQARSTRRAAESDGEILYHFGGKSGARADGDVGGTATASGHTHDP